MSLADLGKNHGQQINAFTVNQPRKGDNGDVLGIKDTRIVRFKVLCINSYRKRGRVIKRTKRSDNGLTVWYDRHAGGRDAGTDYCVLFGGMRNTDDMIDIGHDAFERFVQSDARQIGKAKQGVIRKHTLTEQHTRYQFEADGTDFESHGLCLENTLAGKWRTGLVSMDDRNPFADQNRPQQAESSEDIGENASTQHPPSRDIIDLSSHSLSHHYV